MVLPDACANGLELPLFANIKNLIAEMVEEDVT